MAADGHLKTVIFTLGQQMKPMPQDEVTQRARECGLLVEMWREGTVRISQPGPPRWTPVEPCRVDACVCPALLIGRESAPPLTHLSSRYRILKQNRCVRITDPEELRSVLAELLSKGVCVDNDAYVFSEDGRMLLHVGHHDELNQWTKQ